MGVADELVSRLIRCGVSPLEIEGCSDADIERLQAAAGAPLPESYVEFLRLVGRGAGEFMSDLTAFYPAILSLTGQRRRALARYAVLPDDAFVIADRYGDQAVFIRLSEGPADSHVYYWNGERPRRVKKAFRSVWGFVEAELKGYEYACGD